MVVERKERRNPRSPGAPSRDAGIDIIALTDLGNNAVWWPAIEEIFFLSTARQSFASDRERAAFLETWTGYYREHEPQSILLAISVSGRLAGYLTGCRNSRAAARLYREVESYALFEDMFERYPAHLHVNCHPDFRGGGIGGRLIGAYLSRLRDKAVAGVHVVTAAEARNVSFYRRLGFLNAVCRSWRGRDLLFLGKDLSQPD